MSYEKWKKDQQAEHEAGKKFGIQLKESEHALELSRLESKLAAAKVEIADLEKRNEYQTYECGLCPTETDLSVGHMYCCSCFDEVESQLTAAKGEIEKLNKYIYSLMHEESGDEIGYCENCKR